MESLITLSNRLIQQTNNDFKRSIINRIDWSQPLVEIRGSRGVGKTTLMLQRAGKLKSAGHKVLYISLDTPYFYNHSLIEFAEQAYQYGIYHLFLDEVHRYPSKHKQSDWSLEIKNIHDAIPSLNIVYSGSSILHLFKGKGDLSRRKAGYLMHGLSFREFLEKQNILKTEPRTLTEILSGHEVFAENISKKIKPIPHFKNYLKYGYYPFYDGNKELYINRLREVVNLIIDSDLPNVTTISSNAGEQLKRLLGAISTTVPYVPNMKKLSGNLQITDYRTLLKYLYFLEEAQLIKLLKSRAKGNKVLQKPDKMYLNNTNLSHALALSASDPGTERETFFCNQLSAVSSLSYPATGDFMVDNHWVIEVGGKQKAHRQIKNLEQGYIAADDIEIGYAKKIPLWLFGFLY